MSRGANLAWANFLTTLGSLAPGIARQYDEDQQKFTKLQREESARTGVADILKNMPKVGEMSPDDAQTVLDNTSPQDKAEAVNYLANNRRGLESLRMQMPSSVPQAPGVDNVLQSMSQQQTPRQVKNAFVNRFVDSVAAIESGNQDIGGHPRAANGRQAWGRFGVVPEFHAQRVGLNPNNAADLETFKKDPELQRAAAESFVRELGDKYNWDPAMMRRGYYGIAKDTAAPQRLADGRSMPSSDEDAARFMSIFGEHERPQVGEAAPGRMPWDNTLLESLTKAPPKMKVMPKKVSYGDQERYLLSKVKNPEEMALLGDHFKAISDLARGERDQAHDDVATFQHETDQYNQNVRADAELRFNTWKALEERVRAGHQLRNEELAAARARREALTKQLADVRSFQVRVAAGKEPVELLQAAYPEFYSTKNEGPSGWQNLIYGDNAESTPVTKFDPSKMTAHVQALQMELNSLDSMLAAKSGTADAPAEMPNTIPDLSKYLKPRKK